MAKAKRNDETRKSKDWGTTAANQLEQKFGLSRAICARARAHFFEGFSAFALELPSTSKPLRTVRSNLPPPPASLEPLQCRGFFVG